MPKELGQVSYEAYCENTGWKSLATGDTLPSFELLRPAIKAAWAAAEKAAISLGRDQQFEFERAPRPA